MLIRGHRQRGDDGFTLMELMITVAIMGVIVSGLTGVVISYLKTTTTTQSRMTESLDLQFVTAYWQRDVSSIGVRSKDYDKASHSFASKRSVNVSPCPQVGGLHEVVTLAWSEYSSLVSTDEPDKVTVTYATRPRGKFLDLIRVRCGTRPSQVVVASNLMMNPPAPVCSGGGINSDGCNDNTGAVPSKITLELTIQDPEGRRQQNLTETIVGERRQS